MTDGQEQAGRFGAQSTTEDVLAGLDLSGRRVLITGVSAGLGVETARVLVAHGADVVGAVRDLDKARGAIDGAVPDGPGHLSLVPCDLASLASVTHCADGLLADGRSFDAIIANAAVMACPFGRTEDGFEMQFGTNHLGHFVLVNRLLPLLRAGSRVVVVASAGHRNSDVDLDDPDYHATEYQPFAAYGRSKTANILFAVEFDRRHRDEGIRAVAIHPGVIETELGRHMTAEATAAAAAAVSKSQAPFTYKTVPQGAATSVWAGFVADMEKAGGHYCEDCGIADVVAVDPGVRKGVRPYAVDPDRARALWRLSEKMVGRWL